MSESGPGKDIKEAGHFKMLQGMIEVASLDNDAEGTQQGAQSIQDAIDELQAAGVPREEIIALKLAAGNELTEIQGDTVDLAAEDFHDEA